MEHENLGVDKLTQIIVNGIQASGLQAKIEEKRGKVVIKMANDAHGNPLPSYYVRGNGKVYGPDPRKYEGGNTKASAVVANIGDFLSVYGIYFNPWRRRYDMGGKVVVKQTF